jgi:3-oxoacyl-[acyl-carrier-protein] synthase-3
VTAVAGILGLGVYLPDEVRHNDWWPAEVVERWKAPRTAKDPVAPVNDDEVGAAIREMATDPFAGAVERRVMPATMAASDMEVAAAQRALAAAGIDASEVGLLLVNSWMPDLIGTNAACTVHAGLGLPTDCMTLSTESSFNCLQHQMSLAAAMIATGSVRFALLVQSCSISRFMPYEAPYSPWNGDGATAVVVGRVREGFGLLGVAHRTDGSLQGGLLVGIPDARWFDEGRPILYSPRPELQHKTLSMIQGCARECISTALARAGLTTADVDVYAAHQPVSWFRRVTQVAAGLEHARAIGTFEHTGSLGVCNVPLVLAASVEQGVLRDGDIVVTHSGGSGGTWSSLVLRWGSGAT